MGESSKSIMAHRVQIFLPTTDGILDHIQIDLQGVGRDIVCVKEFLQKNCLHLISCSNKTLITTDCKSATSANFFCQEATCKPLLRKKPWLISWNIIDGKSYILSQLIRLFFFISLQLLHPISHLYKAGQHIKGEIRNKKQAGA